MNSKKKKGGSLGRAMSPIQFGRVAQRRNFEEICQRVRDELTAGTLKPGDKLPPERELAEQFGVGRSALREALRSLEVAGVIELKKGTYGGAFIRQGDPSAMTRVIRDLLSLGTIRLADLTEARSLIQDVVVRLACERRTEADLRALDANIEITEQLTREGRFRERVELAVEFYRLLAAATHNPVLSLVVDSMVEILLSFLRTRIAEGAAKPQSRLPETRRRFMQHLRARDANRAIKELRAHLANVHKQLMAGILSSTRAARRASRPAARKAALA